MRKHIQDTKGMNLRRGKKGRRTAEKIFLSHYYPITQMGRHNDVSPTMLQMNTNEHIGRHILSTQ